MLRIRVSTASAEITETELITAGRVGLQCAFEFNDAWDGLAKTVVIHGGVKRYIVLVGNTILVPGECLARENFPLRIGVYGQDGSGNIVIPTIWVNFGKIRPSAGPIVIPEITPNVAAQIQYNSSEALRIAQEIQEKADNGEFNGRDGATGPRGEDGTDGQNGNSIWTTTETPMPASGGVAFTQLTGRNAVPPIVGDIIIRSSRYVYDVVEVTPGGVVIGHLIGDIKGATGPRGPKGDTGLTGPQGPGVTEDLRAALLQLAQKVAYVDEHGADYYQDLYNALYLPSDIVFITAVFNQGTTKVMDTDSLDSLKPMLTVFGRYDDNTSVVLTNYTLTGVLTPGTSTVTVSALGKTTTFDVLVTGMTSISAVYTQSGTVYTHDTLDSLKADLVVTAHYSDSSTQTVPEADYTLSGTLTAGTSTITVSYGGKTTTFNVTVTAGVPSTYTMYDYIHVPGDNTLTGTTKEMWIALKQYANLNALSCEFAVLRGSGFATSGPAVFGIRSASGALSSFGFYPKDTELGYHLHGDEGTNPPGFTTDVVNVVKYTNTSASPSSLQVNENTPASIVWVNNNTLNLAPVLFTNPINDAASTMAVYFELGYIKFFDLSGNLVGHYFPVIRNSDNRIGVFDVVEQAFHTTSTAKYSTVGNSACMYETGNWS